MTMAKKCTIGGGGDHDQGSTAGTTFVQADSACFRDLVQRLTGPSGNEAPALARSPPPKPTQKLHERRKCKKPNLEIAKPVGLQFQAPSQLKVPSSPPPLMGGAVSPGGTYGYGYGSWFYPGSPSSVVLISPPSSLHDSPVTVGSSNKRVSPSEIELNPGEEQKAIQEKRFYLHPSPRSKQRVEAEPELLTLFPLTSPTTNKS